MTRSSAHVGDRRGPARRWQWRRLADRRRRRRHPVRRHGHSTAVHGGAGNDWLIGDGDHKEYLVGSVITVNQGQRRGRRFVRRARRRPSDRRRRGRTNSRRRPRRRADRRRRPGHGAARPPRRHDPRTRRRSGHERPATAWNSRCSTRRRTAKARTTISTARRATTTCTAASAPTRCSAATTTTSSMANLAATRPMAATGDDMSSATPASSAKSPCGIVTTLEPFVTVGGEKDNLSGGDGQRQTPRRGGQRQDSGQFRP